MADRTLDIYPLNTPHKVLPEALADSLAASGPKFLVDLRTLADRHSLAMWAARYLAAEVYGVQSPNTLAAKSRDLHGFVRWFLELNGHADVAGWYPRDTKAHLEHLEQRGRKPRSVNRSLATLRRFARWSHEQEVSPFTHGLPTRGINELVVDLPPPGRPPQAAIRSRLVSRQLTQRAMHQRPVATQCYWRPGRARLQWFCRGNPCFTQGPQIES